MHAITFTVKDSCTRMPLYLANVSRDITERKRMEEELRLLSDAVRMTTDSVVVTDMRGRVLEINEAGLRMYGLGDRGDFVGKNPLDAIAPEDRRKAIENMAKIMETGHVNNIEYHVLRKDGSRILIETSVSVIKGSSGEPKGLVAVARDITESRKVEEALRESEERFRSVAQTASDAIITVDGKGSIILWNKAAENAFGYSVEEIIGKPLTLIMPEQFREAHLKAMERVMSKGERRLTGKTVEVSAIKKDGSEFPIELTVAVWKSGGETYATSIARDITERKRAEEEKQRMAEQLYLAGRLASVGELAAGVAHELNNPIAAIQGFAQLLTGRNDLDETMKNDLGIIYREAQRAAKITQNLLSFARRHEPEKHLVSINEVIEKTLELRAYQMKVNNIEVVVEFATDLPKTMVDFFQMQQVFVNIINNAEQAMLEAHGKGRIVAKTQTAGNMIQATFADNGPGIAEENLKRIFDPFFTTKEVGKGTGLGLSICFGLVEAHGGHIYARSKLGEGATFVVEIPIVSEGQ